MITIIPNWHPIFVHFTIGLLGSAVVFYFASALLSQDHKWKQQWQHMANWSLWSGCLVTIFTACAGLYAYNTVAHDGTSHVAMTIHRNWAVATASLFIILGLSAINIVRNNKTPHFLFLSTAAVAGVMLLITGFLGGEAVYRYGLGVMSLPAVEEGGHHHDHDSAHNHDQPAHQHDDAEPHHHNENMDSDSDTHQHSSGTEDELAAPHDHDH